MLVRTGLGSLMERAMLSAVIEGDLRHTRFGSPISGA
jgi:hypothetical protein